MKVYGGIGFAGQDGLSRSPFNSDLNNFQPRIGAAYQINSKTVLRGGWAIFYLAPTDSGLTSGFSQNTPYVATQDSGRTPFNTITNPFPTGLIQPSGAVGGHGHLHRTGRHVRQHRRAEIRTCTSSPSEFSANCPGTSTPKHPMSARGPCPRW